MTQANFQIDQSFPVQFAWRLPEGGMLYAVFQAEVLDIVPAADKYVVRLNELLAGRETNANAEALPAEAISRSYWALVGALVGNKVTVAYEADDGRALHMRLETLTGEHNFFTRYETAEAKLAPQSGEDSPP